MAEYVRQAVVIIHGMGEQRPLDTVKRFIGVALAADAEGKKTFFSRPESVTGSYESRRFLAPPAKRADNGEELRAHTEFFEYHWAHLMQGNRLDDLWPALRRILLQRPRRVPAGLRPLWAVAWGVLFLVVWGLWRGPLSTSTDVGTILRVLFGTGATAMVVAYLLARVLPRWLTTNFVDVVRYLDTSPRSYEVRRQIRAGLVELLQNLHDARLNDAARYQRIVVVAHSLGAFVAYDGISYLWGRMNQLHAGSCGPVSPIPDGLELLERAASALPDQPGCPHPGRVSAYQAAQRVLWRGLRAQGNPWLVTDLITVGTPMYFSDQLLHACTRKDFNDRIARRELPTCPPQNEESERNNIHNTRRFYSWEKGNRETRRGKQTVFKRRVIYEGAPFAVVRWTNMWFPLRYGLFGDWFGGPLAPLFGAGIRDVAILGNRPRRLIPGYAHSLYFDLDRDESKDSATTLLREALDLASTSWLKETVKGTESHKSQSGTQPPFWLK